MRDPIEKIPVKLCQGPICKASNAIRTVALEGRCWLCLEVERPDLYASELAAGIVSMAAIDRTPGY